MLFTVDQDAEDDFPPCDCADKAPPLRYWRCPKCDAEWGIDPNDDEPELGIQKEPAK